MPSVFLAFQMSDFFVRLCDWLHNHPHISKNTIYVNIV